MSRTRRWGFWASLLTLTPVLVIVPYISNWTHYALPEPVQDLFHPKTGAVQISERAILEHARVLSEDIGFRTVGTREHAAADAWMHRKALELKELCEETVRNEPGRKLECEVWRQVGSGNHRFDILGTRLYKSYVNLTNIVVRVSDGTERGKEHAVLVNAHVDSTLPSPGAGDDALAVGVMLELARNLIHTKEWEPNWSIVFLFNNAEESLQDGSHLFSTQHPIRTNVRAVINLEAAGTTGPELVFQATSEQMIDAYAHVPRPHGTVLANDIFSSGIIMSDTDFRQFELYMNVTGLDMAIIGNSYFYHTRKDMVKYIEAGVAQHMAENTMALLKYLSSPESPLPSLTGGYTRPTTVFFSLAKTAYIRYSFQLANAMHIVLFVSVVALLVASGGSHSAATSTGVDVIVEHLKSMINVNVPFLGGIVSANVVAFIMSKVINRSLSWFREEFSCVLLYAPAALAGALAVHILLPIRTTERVLFTGTMLTQSFLAVVVQLAGVGSAVAFFLSAVSLFVAVATEYAFCGKQDDVWLGAYAIGQIVPVFIGTEIFFPVSDFFVPLTGRMGSDAPAEHIIASMVSIILSYAFPLTLPFIQRFGRRFTQRAFLVTLATSIVMMVVFSFRQPFDAMHPKRLYILHSENITSNEVSLHIASSDAAPKFGELAQAIASYVSEGTQEAAPVKMTQYNGDWDSLYPFSAFLDPYKVQLESYVSPWAVNKHFTVKAVNDVTDLDAGTRSLRIEIYHPGLIWTVIAFDAHVLTWSLDGSPPPERVRHHIKEASFYGEDVWSVDLTMDLRNEPNSDGIHVNFVGIQETAMWPGKAKEKEKGGQAMKVFERLDRWLEEHTGGTVDATLLGCVGGAVVI